MISKRLMPGERPVFPKRAVVTGGMPYGNKNLHFGHVGGMFVHADIFARFLRDRIGKDNVIFVSGTDCYGSPIVESYRNLKENGYKGTLEEYVEQNHKNQKKTLDDYEISLNLYGASALGKTGEVHSKFSKELFETLYQKGYIEKISTPQFYDEELGVFLNGRQVLGRCPIEGCTSEKAYADECSLGHQYMPSELIDPISVLSGKKPSFRDVTNWYFGLEDCIDMMKDRIDYLRKNSNTRKYILNIIDEFLKKPFVHVPKKYIDDLEGLEAKLPQHTTINEENKKSITFIFENLEDRDKAKAALEAMGIHYTAGKTLVPFRLSGNVEWGVPVPDFEDQKDLTFWVWPESLWAPISFTKAYLESCGADEKEWLNWWNNDEAMVYQFIGEDNIYFYAIAEMALFAALLTDENQAIDMEKINLPQIIANRHILFMDTKASSSSEIKPPMADELLEFYTPEQLRMHFMSLGLSSKSTGFKPQVYMKEEEKQGVDMVLKEGNLLTNVYNRLIRSCFYTIQTYFEGKIPTGNVSESILKLAEDKALEYERHMYNHDFHRLSYVLDDYIREINKYWVNNSKIADQEENQELRKQIVIDSFYTCKVLSILVHPIAPSGCEMLREYMNFDESLWNWDAIFEPLEHYVSDLATHEVKFLEPRIDFFSKLECQFK
ncbi:MAG: class I tRNA ligase family protein [Cellulosilyticaceae bacterium]